MITTLFFILILGLFNDIAQETLLMQKGERHPASFWFILVVNVYLIVFTGIVIYNRLHGVIQ